MRIIIAVFFLTLCSLSKADGMFILSESLLVADWAQSRQIAREPANFSEGNILLGAHPSMRKVDLYFAGALIGNYLFSENLSDKRRKQWLIGVSIVEGSVVAHNWNIGLRSSF